MITVSELAVYPIKSCRQRVVTERFVDALGFRGDRRWMVVDKSGKFITQRQYPRLVLVTVEEQDTGIVVSAEGMTPLAIATPAACDEASLSVLVWKDECQAVSAGEDADEWFSCFLGVECRLVWMPDTFLRQVDRAYASKGDQVSFADGFSFLLISDASLAALNERLDIPVPMRRFRPNIVVSGCDPHEEDWWDRIRIGDIEFSVVKPCSRCVMTTVDTQLGVKTGQPLRTLASYRRDGNSILFGQNLIHHGQGSLAAGMKLEVLKNG